MSLSDVDRQLLHRCLDNDPKGWRDFADRFLGLVVHVVHRTAGGRGVQIDESTRDDLVAEVFLTLLQNDMAVLRQFRRQCSLATYLTVISRRIVVRRLIHWDRQTGKTSAAAGTVATGNPAAGNGTDHNGHHADPASGHAMTHIDDSEQLQQLLLRLDPREASVVRMYHLEGKSYSEISRTIGINENTIGPMLHRARMKMND